MLDAKPKTDGAWRSQAGTMQLAVSVVVVQMWRFVVRWTDGVHGRSVCVMISQALGLETLRYGQPVRSF